MRKRFRSGVNIARTRSFPGADIGSDQDLLMMTFHLRLKRISKPFWLKFDLEKLKDANVLETFQAMINLNSLRHGDQCREDQADDKQHQWHQHRGQSKWTKARDSHKLQMPGLSYN